MIAKLSTTPLTLLSSSQTDLRLRPTNSFSLSISSEVFPSQFFGPLADKTVKTVKVSDSIDSNIFRIMIKSIYYSGFVPDLDISEYLELLEAASFYLLHEVIYECNRKLCEHIQSLNIEDLVDWSVKVSQLSIHDQLYGSCREAILAKLSSILKEEKWDCFSSEVRKRLLEDLEYYEVWKGDLLLYLQVLKRLSSLGLNSLLPERIVKFNSKLETYFQSMEHYKEFLVDRFKDKLASFWHWMDDDDINDRLNKSSYFRVKLKRIKFELYTEPDDQTWTRPDLDLY